MLSVNDERFEQWWDMMINHPDDTARHLKQLEYMIKKQGLNLDEETYEGLTIVDSLLCELEDALSEAHTLHFDQILLWVCERVTPNAELIKGFRGYPRCYHALDEVLKRYEGPVINFRGQNLDFDFAEVLLGYENVVDIEALDQRYRAALNEHQPRIWTLPKNVFKW
jgi:hypothetical protein